MSRISSTPARFPSTRRKDLWAMAALVAVILAPWARSLWDGAMPFFMDTWMYFYPLRRLAGVLMRGGVAPFWNPSEFCGTPLLGNPQAGVLYPGHWLFLLVPSGGMFTLTMVGHVIFAAVGTFLFLRWLGCSRWASWFGALVLAWNGWTWAHYAFGSYYEVWAWWPWQWWVLLAWIRRGGLGWRTAGVVLGFLAAMQLLAGAPQLVLYNALASALLLAVGWSIGPGPKKKTAVRFLAGCGIAVALGLGWAAPQLLPTRAFFSECVRTQALPLEEIRGGALSTSDTARALLGGAGYPEDAETTTYFGAFGVALFLVGLMGIRRRREFGLLTLPVILGLVLAWRPLTGLWSAVIPGFAYMHDPRRAMALLSVALPIVGAFGLDSLRIETERSERRTAERWVVFGGAVVVCDLAARFWLGGGGLALPPAGHRLSFQLVNLRPFPYFSGVAQTILGFSVAVLGAVFFFVASRPKTKVETSKTAGSGNIENEDAATDDDILTPSDVAPHATRSDWSVALIGGWALVLLFVFAINRIDLKAQSREPITKYAISLNRLAAGKTVGTDTRPEGASVPVRFFFFDRWAYYSYDYAPAESFGLLTPNLASCTWPMDSTRWPGLCDAQGYDPALPRRYSELMSAINEGHIALYGRHFALVRAPRSPLLPRLGVQFAQGPVERYVLPILPARLGAGQTRKVRIEEPSDYTRIHVTIFHTAPGELRFTSLDAAGRTLHSVTVPYNQKTDKADHETELTASVPTGFGHDARAILFHNRAAKGSGSIDVAMSLEWPTLPSGIEKVDATTTRPLIPRPLFRLTHAFPYAAVTRKVSIVPMDEEASTIARRMLLGGDNTVVLEWPGGTPMPSLPGPGGSRTGAGGKAGARAGTVRVDSWKPGRVKLEADVVGGNGGAGGVSDDATGSGAALVLREPFFKGWRVYVDGTPREPVPADLAFQAVWLEPGRHTVEWMYRPPGFRLGVLVAVLATLVAVALVFSKRKRQTGEKNAAANSSPAVSGGGA